MPGQKLDSMILVGPFQLRLSYISIKYSIQFSLRYLELLKLWGFFLTSPYAGSKTILNSKFERVQ